MRGVEWGADETAQRLIEKKLIEPLIIVAVANTGVQRIHEYAPTRGMIDSKRAAQTPQPGLAAQIRPVSDRGAETVHRPDLPHANLTRNSTGLGGSSLGGLADARARALVSAGFQPARRALAVGLVG